MASKQPGPAGKPISFYLVPLHLKAMAEGSLRRKMASKILAEAVAKKAAGGEVTDFVLGGDANAPLDSGDFANLTDSGLVAASAADAEGGAFSYIKGPRSLIDHIFLSPNLAADTPADFFIVAAEKSFPDYVDEISDHRPILLRLSLGAGGPGHRAAAASRDTGGAEPLAELKERLAGFEFAADGFEKARRGPDLSRRGGYDPDFLGGGLTVPLPGLPPDGPESEPVVVNDRETGIDRYVLPYTHYSVVLNGGRKLPYFSAVNIDGNTSKRFTRGDAWFLDPRVPADLQCGPAVYANNDLDRGHMTRRLDPVWGPDHHARQADADTFCFTNACPQHKDLNQKEWARLEDYVLQNAGTHGLKVCVFTGPVCRPGDMEYRGVKLPKEFWKVVAIRRADTAQAVGDGVPAEPGRHDQRVRVRLRPVQDLPGEGEPGRRPDGAGLRPAGHRRPAGRPRPRVRGRRSGSGRSDRGGEFGVVRPTVPLEQDTARMMAPRRDCDPACR